MSARGDARKRLAALQAEADNGFHHGIRAWVDNNSGAAKVIQAIDELPITELRALARQLLEDADTTHPDPFLRGCATGTTDTAKAILEQLGKA